MTDFVQFYIHQCRTGLASLIVSRRLVAHNSSGHILTEVDKSSAVAEMAAQRCTSRIVKRWIWKII